MELKEVGRKGGEKGRVVGSEVERCGVLWSDVECCGVALWSRAVECCGVVLWSRVVECGGVLWCSAVEQLSARADEGGG